MRAAMVCATMLSAHAVPPKPKLSGTQPIVSATWHGISFPGLVTPWPWVIESPWNNTRGRLSGAAGSNLATGSMPIPCTITSALR